MDSDRCKELLEKYRTAMGQFKDAQKGAKQAVITEPLEPENTAPAVDGSRLDDPYRREKEAQERLQQAEKEYRDCIGQMS